MPIKITRRFAEPIPTTTKSYTVYYWKQAWWDEPPVRHSDGCSFSYSDGHSDYYKRKGTGTLEFDRKRDLGFDITGKGQDIGHQPDSLEEIEDLHRLQRGCRGELGYTPTGL
jgi:hypothetical protein